MDVHEDVDQLSVKCANVKVEIQLKLTQGWNQVEEATIIPVAKPGKDDTNPS